MPNPIKITFLRDKNILRGVTDFTTREAEVGKTYEPQSTHLEGKGRPSTVKLVEVLDDQTVVIANVGGKDPGKRRAMEAQEFLAEYGVITEDRRPVGQVLGAGKSSGPRGAGAVNSTLYALLEETRESNKLARETNELLKKLLAAWGAGHEPAQEPPNKKAG